MSTVFQVLGNKQSLPVSQGLPEQGGAGIRRRLSSVSLNLQIQQPSSISAWAALRRSKSMSAAAGSSIRGWWERGWGWILARKPTFAADLEMNEEEAAAIGSNSRGSWRHVLYKATTQLRRRLLGSDNVGLPQTFRYDYAKSFDGGRRSASLVR
ncbi:GATA type zinc finger transcription factor family protein [Striga asiatica]|uniref:GATA type zinc finger transcription factor family protein n=1 Tax=Striga asiatica TaxID=4170 RepID=A0A5A7RKP1_STRAF|nr:GATA type zinc finger transcription factor family protein [Striga asiatica]